jgi:glycosyltransferase involved in cell wall biosynthesis
MKIVPLTVIIPTRNEEANLRQTLMGICDWVSEIYVFDSYSTDRTLEVAEEFNVKIAQRSFDNFAAHKNWAIDNLPIRTEWLLLLDADERVSHELRDEISAIVSGGTDVAGYYVARKNYFMGSWLRHAGMFPDWQLRLFRHKCGRFEDRAVHEHVLLKGTSGYLKSPLEHNDFKSLSRWFDRHNVYTSLEAEEVAKVIARSSEIRMAGDIAVRGPARTRKVKEFGYKYLPCRALLVFVWMYVVRMGFLDGRIGFRYCILKAFVDYQTSLKVVEARHVRHRAEPPVSAGIGDLSWPDLRSRRRSHFLSTRGVDGEQPGRSIWSTVSETPADKIGSD